MAFPRLTIWQQWLLHACLLWLSMNLADALTFWYEVYTHGSYLINSDGSPVSVWQRFANHNGVQLLWLVILGGTLLIELNYHRLFKARSLPTFLLVSFVASAVFVRLLLAFNQWRFEGSTDRFWEPTLTVFGYGIAYALVRSFFNQRIQQTQRQVQQSQAELAALKAQLNPHFFFNTLNSLYGTALLEQATNTAQSIEQLANIMRYTLGEAQRDFTPVASELGFLQDYIQLQGLRLAQTDANRLQTHLVYDELPAQIAPLLLITFVENAFLYGVSTDLDYFIAIQLTIEKGQLDLVVENRLFPQRTAYGLGTGIQNARKRLDLLYAGKYSLTAGPQADRFRVHLQMNLH